MKKIKIYFLISISFAILFKYTYSTTESPDDDEDYDDEVDDDSKIYKNPRNFPSADCPRDEEQATLLGQKCLRKCSSDEDCKSRKKKCLCDGACGKSCIKPDRECPEVQQPSLGSVTLSGKTFGSRATYTCPHGYHVVGLQSRLCQADGNWAGTEPACKQNIYCLAPPTIEHARHSALPEQATFDLDSTVQYHCHLGYSTAGFPRAKCLAIDGQASWYGPDISCEPRSCGQPTDPVNGWHAGECYTYGCRITYHCGEGYELVGKQEKFCQADGAWTPKELPTCVLVTAVQCPPPENPKNGKAIYTSCSYNSVVSYECKYGYTLVGESSRRCGADKKWSGQTPICKEINCGHPGILFNGWLENIDAGTGLGASVIFRCHPGMLLVGNSSTVCQIDGKWRYSLPHCLAPCVVPSVSQGTVIPIEVETENNNISTTIGYSLSSKVRHGTSLEVLCNENYEFPLSSQSPPTCYNGTWSIIPKCVPAKCKTMPKTPKFGIVLAAKTEHGMRAVFKCKDGFILKYPNGTDINDTTSYALSCSFGNWTGETPYCQEVYCQFPGYIDHGKVLLVGNMGLYDYRPYVKKVINNKQIMYDCDKGYVLEEGPPGATCIGGRWSPAELPKCLLGQHPRIRWNRRRRSTDLKLYKIGSKYLLNHLPSSIKHKRLKRQTEKSLNDADESETSITSSNDDRKQKNKLPCEQLPKGLKYEVLKTSKDSKSDFGQGTVIKVICDQVQASNSASFNNTIKCIKGQWKPDIPKCYATPCAVPTTEHGKYYKNILGNSTNELPASTEIHNEDVVMFTCNFGYNLQGPSSLKCHNGKWIASSFPECLPSPCVLPNIQQAVYQGGYRAGLTIAHSSSVIIQCETSSGVKSSIQLDCTLGKLIPENIKCDSIVNTEPISIVASDTSTNTSVVAITSSNVNSSCKSPQKFDEYLNYKHDHVTADAGFPEGTEILFSCIPSITGETKTWKIICESGIWVGRAVPCETDEDGFSNIPLINGSCIFRNNDPHVISFFNDLEIREEYVEFPPDSTIVSRCIDIGKYAMIGSNERKCLKSKWTGTKPHCFGLNQENDYAMEKAPTILFRHQNGPIAQSNDGKLIVYPGATVHMECLWMRRFGNPKWNVSHEYRKYPEGWTTEEGRDPQLEYRLSILHAVKEDSGIYTCATPARHTHAIEVVVKAMHCAPLISRRGLALSSTDTMMNSKITFRCTNGNALIGAHETICLPSGNWSSPLPVCESVECGDVPLVVALNSTAPRVTVLSREVGGRAAFSCPIGYGIRGPSESICLGTGEWSIPFPTCVEVQCQHPGAPQNGYAQGSPPYRAGDVVQFNCNPEFMMQGQPIIACQDNGRWSGGLPKCIQACSYPGTAISGRMSNVKFYYNVGEIITFSCDAGLELRGTKMIRCLKNGKWSNAIPTCLSQTLTVMADIVPL